MIDRFIRHYVDGYHAYKNGRWCYEDGCFYKGLADLYRAGEGDWLLAALIDHVNRRVKPDGAIEGYAMDDYSLDNIQAGRVLFLLRDETGDPRYAKALHTLRAQLINHPRTRANNFWHKKAYPWQVWLDGLYMALPLLADYSLDYEEGGGLPDVRGQIETVRRLMHDPRTGLYYTVTTRAAAPPGPDPKTGRSASFWSRAIGWSPWPWPIWSRSCRPVMPTASSMPACCGWSPRPCWPGGNPRLVDAGDGSAVPRRQLSRKLVHGDVRIRFPQGPSAGRFDAATADGPAAIRWPALSGVT